VRYSLIIPTLNEEKLLPGLLNQICQIEYQKKYLYEVIIADGGSTDNTLTLAREFPCFISSDCDTGSQNIAKGRNQGASSARGEILIFLNADVRMPDVDHFFTVFNREFYQSPSGAMTCRVEVFPDERKWSDTLFHAFYNQYFYMLNRCGVGMGRGECQIVRRSVFEEVGGYNDNLAAGEDFDLFRRIRRHYPVYFCKKLVIFESPRRYRHYGYWKVAWQWTKNALSVMLRNRSYSNEWEPIR